MRSSLVITSIAKYLVILILVASFAFGLYWLWMRQPKPQVQQSPQSPTQNTKQETKETFEIIPKDNSVLSQAQIKFQGKTKPDSIVAIYSNDFNFTVKSNQDGRFEQEIILPSQLNLVKVATIKDLKIDPQNTLTFWVTDVKKTKPKEMGTVVYTGAIKTIFEKLITITSFSGEKNIQVTGSTEIQLPEGDEEEIESTKSALSFLRVGDYLVILADLAGDNLAARQIQVFRKNKPQIEKQLAIATILTSPRQSLFSVRELKSNQIMKFTLNKNSQIFADGSIAKTNDIIKDKNAIIIWHSEVDSPGSEAGKNIADLIHPLP